MRVDFYQLSKDPVDITVAKLARKVLQAGERLVVVAADEGLRERLSKTLWEQGGGSFLAHGPADGPHAARQPILISDTCAAPNEARMAILADGQWREDAARFDRAMLLFDAEATEAARGLWRKLDPREDIDNRIFKQTPEGGWREGR
ncbi:DNA polymerase III subunit chi [Qipengyuania aurantiaca]|uniref:DNA polymerase III subunit chi n=1 Tax=Qipengyuania aurantiaca TaxID=2867233 RepID=A0ABX8ZQ19_9SPHN|nr:DNA polymerase III subunit chi [Qipengyuania aurantiaca]QZD91118.1 DNA polymerase III subunit chi [Qipengyuania aurantiaca]